MAEIEGPRRYRFGPFVLDTDDRLLLRGHERLGLNSRYFDALALLVSEQGRLLTKERFLTEVWRGVPVTDEALTQCIRTLRRELGDDAAMPRFIETIPKHGYRFVAPVEQLDKSPAGEPPLLAEAPIPGAAPLAPSGLWTIGTAGTAGGGLAGLIGGLVYGFIGASQPPGSGTGAVSVVLVIALVSIAMAFAGAAGVSFGIAAAARGLETSWLRNIAGGALGGLVVGALVKLIGLDAMGLLFGRAPADITGAAEGAILGAATGLAAALARRTGSLERAMALGGICGGVAGVLIALAGGRLMAASLDLLADRFPGSRVRLDPIGHFFGEDSFGPVSRIATAGFEGMLFGALVIGAMLLVRQRRERLR